MPGAIGFDFDHTLGIDNKVERMVGLEMAERLATARGLEFDHEAAIVAFDKAVGAARNQGLPIETALEGVFLELAGPGKENSEETGRFREEVVKRAPRFVQALPGAQEMLAALDALGIRYAILTNGWSPLQEEKARLIGFRGPVLVSERIGVRKPCHDAFALLAKQFSLTPYELWYVGDEPSVDCEGARAAGMTAVWFDSGEREFPSDLPPPAHVIHGLVELPVLVQGQPGGAAKPAAT